MRYPLIALIVLALLTIATAEDYTSITPIRLYPSKSKSLSHKLKQQLFDGIHASKMVILEPRTPIKVLKRKVENRRQYREVQRRLSNDEIVSDVPENFTREYHLIYGDVLEGEHKGLKGWVVERFVDR